MKRKFSTKTSFWSLWFLTFFTALFLEFGLLFSIAKYFSQPAYGYVTQEVVEVEYDYNQFFTSEAGIKYISRVQIYFVLLIIAAYWSYKVHKINKKTSAKGNKPKLNFSIKKDSGE